MSYFKIEKFIVLLKQRKKINDLKCLNDLEKTITFLLNKLKKGFYRIHDFTEQSILRNNYS